MKKQLILSLTFAALAAPAMACGYDFFRIHDLDFLDDSHGFRITNDGLQQSVDGGRKWKDLRVDGEPKDKAFNYRTYTELDIAEGTLFLLSPPSHLGVAKLHISDDLGRDWETIELAKGMSPVHIDFVNSKHGFVQLSDNRLLVTDDGAQTWMEVAQAPKEMEVTQLTMADEKRGFALALLPRDSKYINLLLTTENGGRNWTVKELGSTDDGYYQLQGLADGNALLQNGRQVLLAMPGQEELKQMMPTTEGKTVSQALFRDAMTGVVSRYDNASGESEVLFTHDGGATFSLVPDFLMEYEFAWAFAPNSLKVISLQDFFLEVPATH
jgi:hypothetical protein